MGVLADRLDDLHVTVSTPDETCFGELRGRTGVRVWFAPGYYQYSDAGRLQQKLAQVGRLLYVAHMKEYWDAMSEAWGRPMSEAPAEESRFNALAREIESEGVSDDGIVNVRAIGMYQWAVTLPANVTSKVSEEEFSRAAQQAGERVLVDHLAKMKQVKFHLYQERHAG
jgi:hypothetical protein